MLNNVTYKLSKVFHFNFIPKYPLNSKKQLTQQTEKLRIKICPPQTVRKPCFYSDYVPEEGIRSPLSWLQSQL